MPQPEKSEGLKLVLVLPALNEELTVGDTIRKIPRDIPGIREIRVVVVNDGSTDATAQRATEAGARVVSHWKRRGVGAAFQTGLNAALEMGADVIASMDADGQFDPLTLPQLLAPVVSGQADFATASRFADPKLEPEMPRLKRWGNRRMSRLISRLTGQEFHDVSCGMRAYSRRAAMSLNLLGSFTYTQEVFLNLAYKQMRMVEVPISVRGVRKHGKSRVASNLFHYGWRTLDIIFRCYRDYKPMRFFGRAAMGLMVPAVCLELFLLVWWAHTGFHTFTPHKWAGFTGAGLAVGAFLLLAMGIIGDMLNRHRIYLEEVLYHVRNANLEKLRRLEKSEKSQELRQSDEEHDHADIG